MPHKSLSPRLTMVIIFVVACIALYLIGAVFRSL
jgi:hypothetical protein